MKLLNKFYAVCLCFFIGTAITLAQNENFEWTAKSYLVSINDVDVEINSNLSKQASKFTWEQVSNLSTHSQQFNVTAVTGSWDTSQNLGNLSYQLNSTDTSASLLVSGTTEDISMQFTIHDENGNPVKTYVFLIDNFTNI